MEKPNVYNYHDYLLFIKDWITYKQTNDPNFSLRKWSKAVDASPSLLTMIFKNERTLSLALFQRMSLQLDLKKKEREVLFLLQTIATSEKAEERSKTYAQLIKIPEYKKQNLNNLKVFEYLSNWINVAIRELSFTNNFADDPVWIKNRLRGNIDISSIEKSLNFLKKNNYLTLDENNKWKPTQNKLDCSDGVYKLSLSDFHRSMFDLANQSIEEVSRDNRYITGHTFSISEDNYNEAQEILNEALSKIQNLKNKKETTHVYQMQLALFPLTKINKDV